MSTWLILTFILGALMAFSIGANDAANSLGVSYGTEAISMTKLIVLGAVAEFTGAMFFSGNVASALSDRVILNLKAQTVEAQSIIMFSVCFSCFIFVTMSVCWAMPISGTHAVIGSLLGAGWIIVGFDHLNTKEVLHIMSSWVTSPLLAGAIAYILMLFIAQFSMNTKTFSYQARIISTQIIFAFCAAILSDFIHDIVDQDSIKSKNKLKIMTEKDLVRKDAYGMNMYVQIIAFVVTLIFSRFLYLMTIMSLTIKPYTCSEKLKFIMKSIFLPHKTDFLEEITCTVNVCSSEELVENREAHLDIMQTNYKKICELFNSTTMRHQVDFIIIDPKQQDFNRYIIKYNSFAEGREIDRIDEQEDERQNNKRKVSELEQGIIKDHMQTLQKLVDEDQNVSSDEKRRIIQMYTYQQAVITTQVYRVLLLMGTFLVSMSHGSNDVGNAISPILHLVTVDAQDISVKWVFFAGSIAIAFGLILLGERTMSTIGSKLIKLDYMKGFVVCYSTGLSVAFGSLQGIPLSTTHCVVGAMTGIYFAGKCSIVLKVYTLPKDPSKESRVGVGNEADIIFSDYQEPTETIKLNLDTIKDIVLWCVITIPVSFIFSASICWCLKLMFLSK